MTAEPSFPLRRVLMALELSEATVTNWSRSNAYGLEVEASGRGRGRNRQLTLQTVTKLAFMKAFVEAGLAVSKAAQHAEECLSAMRTRPPIKTMTIYTWSGRTAEVTYNGANPGLAVPPWSAVTLFAAEVIKLTEEALRWQYPPGFDHETYEAEWQPESDPQKPRRARKASPPKA